MSDNIKVVVKVRPLIPREIEDKLSYQWRVKSNTLYQLDSSGKENGAQYTFDQVYDEKTKTEDVYKDVAKPIVEAAVAGFNGTIFAYGQTSSGKTYTMSGTDDSPGIIQLSVLNLFDQIKSVPKRDFLVRVSYIEIYNETLKDLLNAENDKIKIHETQQGMRVTATEKFTSSPEEVMEIMREGEANRQIGATNMNEESSRSHSIFQITVESREHTEGEDVSGSVNVSILNLVDLAGSERSGQTGATGKRFKEGTHINKSLSVLALVIKQLSDFPNKHANYRDSKLTRILQNSLGGNAKTSIICAVTPAALEETISTLQFANRAKVVKNKPEVNAVHTDKTKLQDLTKQLSKLQSELATKNNIEQHNHDLLKQIRGLQKMILNGFGQRSADVGGGCRRKTWCASRRATISALPALTEEAEVTVRGFCTPALKYNPLSLPLSDFQPIQKPSQLAPVSEEPILKTPPNDKKVNFGDEIIDLDSDEDNTSNTSRCSPYHKCFSASKTPPCVLRKNAKMAEKNLKDIVELTKREKIYEPEVLEYMEKYEQSTNKITELEDEIKSLGAKNFEKDSEVKQLLDKITQTENKVKQVSSAKAELEARCNEFNTKVTDLEVSYETLKMKSKLREDELLSLLNEQTNIKKRTEHRKGLSRTLDKEFSNFMDLSKDISLVSDNDSSVDTSNTGDSSTQLQDLVYEMKTQIAAKNEAILNLENDLSQHKLTIESLENTCKELREQVNKPSNTLLYVDQENTLLKSSIETLNSTISSQKQNLEMANNDIQSYNSSIQKLQSKLKVNNGNFDLDISDNLIDDMIAHEEKIIANNENLRNIIKAFKTALDAKAKNIETLKSSLESKTSDDELLQIKDEQIKCLLGEVKNSQKQFEENETIIEKLMIKCEDLDKCHNVLSDKLLIAEQQNVGLEKKIIVLQKDNNHYVNQLKEFNEKYTETVNNLNDFKNNLCEIQAENEELRKLQSGVATKNDLIAELRCEILSRDNLITSLTSDHSNSQDKFKSIITKLQQLFSVLTGDECVQTEITDDSVVLFTTLYERLNDVEVTAKEVISQKKVALINKNILEKELEILQNKVKDLEDQRNKVVFDNDTLNQRINQLTIDLNQVQIKITDLNVVKSNLHTELQMANENIQRLNDDIVAKESKIIHLQTEQGKLRLEIEMMVKERQRLKIEVENLQLLIDTNQAKYKNLLQCKDNEIMQLKQKSANTDLMLDENGIDLKSLCKTLDETVHNRDQVLGNIEKAATNLMVKLEIQHDEIAFTNSDHYSNVVLILETATHMLSKLKTDKSMNDNSKALEETETKQRIDQLQEQLEQALESLSCFEQDNEILLDETEKIKESNKKLSKDLLKSSEILQELEVDVKEKLQIIENLEFQINKWKGNFAKLEESMKQQIMDLQQSNYELQSQHSQRFSDETYSVHDRELSDVESSHRQAFRKSLSCILVEPGNASPESLLTLCCNKILEVFQPSETDLKTPTSSSLNINLETKNTGTQTNTCDCDKLLEEKDIILTENFDLKTRLDFLQYINLNLLKEQEEVRKELELLVEPAKELHKKISNHRTNLSTFTATTSAENKLLKSQVKVLQHLNNRFFSVCQRDLPAFKKLLQELSTILKSTPLTNRLESNIKRFSLPEVLERNSSASNYKDESILNGDILMLDTNVTLASADNTILAQDQTCLDGTYIYLDTEINTDVIQAIDPNVLHTQLEILMVENRKMTDKIENIKEENLRLRKKIDYITANAQPDIRKEDAQSSPIKPNSRLSDVLVHNAAQDAVNLCDYCKNVNAPARHESMAEELQLLKKEILKVREQNVDLKNSYNDICADIIAHDKLVLRISALEKDNKAKICEINELTLKLSIQSDKFNQLQEENDTLSTQVMEIIDESESLRKELDILNKTNSASTVSHAEELVKSENAQASTTMNCLKCANNAPANPVVHSSLNRSHSDSESSSRFNKLSTLQNELQASREDCKTISQDVATIKNHLAGGNLSISHKFDLDDRMGESNVFPSSTETALARPNTNMTANSDVPEKNPIEMYDLDKQDCFHYYLEKTGAENNFNQKTRIIDIMKLFYTNLLEKHGNEVENLVNKLKDFEESRNQLHEKIINITAEYSKINKEILDKNNRIISVANVVCKVKKNLTHLDSKMSASVVDKNTVVEMFKETILRILDTEFELPSVSIFEKLIDKVVNKYQNDLVELMNKYSDLQSNMKVLTSELIDVTKSLNQMKCQLSENEKEYSLLKAQKERLYEINNAVTLDIVKKDQELSDTINNGFHSLQDCNVFTQTEVDLSRSVNQNILLLIEKLKELAKQNDLACQEKHNLLLEQTKSKTVLGERDEELESLNSQLEQLRELCKNATNELQIKNEAIEAQTSLHAQLTEVYKQKVDENLANITIIENLMQEILVLKEKLDSCKEESDDSETKAKITELIESVNNLEHENKQLKSINKMLTSESEQNAVLLAKADETIKNNKTELEKMTAEILSLNQSMTENLSEIESLKQEAKNLLEHNVAMKQQFEETNEVCSRLKLNMKTHEKTAEIQCKILNRLKREKEESDKLANKIKEEVEELKKESESLKKDREKLTEDINKYRRIADEMKEAKELLEKYLPIRVSESEKQTDVKVRTSLGVGDSRRRRQSLLNSKRTFCEDKEPDHKRIEAYFSPCTKPDEMFMDVDDNSNRSTPNRTRRSDSYQSRNDESDREEGGSRPSSALARRRRRQSLHDQHRNTARQPDNLNTLDENNKQDSEVPQLKERLELCQHELEELREKYREVDEECEICAEYLRERDAQCLQLKDENKDLKQQISELNDRLLNASVDRNQKDARRSFVNAAVNTDEDWANLHSVVVDRMSFDREVDKNKILQRSVDELRFKNGELKVTLAKLEKSVERAAKNKANIRELEATKLELATCKQELDACKKRCKELDEECETCGEYLRDRDEQVCRLKETRDALEARLEELLEKEAINKVHSVRKKRQSMHDQNRNSTIEQSDASTETKDLSSYQVERDSNSALHISEVQQLKMAIERLSQQNAGLEMQLRSMSAMPGLPPVYVATGSAIVQNQHLTDVMKENQKLKKLNAKLITICKKRGKPLGESNRENDDPAEMG